MDVESGVGERKVVAKKRGGEDMAEGGGDEEGVR